MNLDKKKLREAIAEISQRRRQGYTTKEVWPTWPPYPQSAEARQAYADGIAAYQKDVQRSSAEWATRLCALMAHSRGHLHIVKEWVPTNGADGALKLVERTMEDQAKLVDGIAAEFEKTPEQIAAEERRRAEHHSLGVLRKMGDGLLADALAKLG